MRAIIQTDGESGHLGILVQQLVFHDHLGNKYLSWVSPVILALQSREHHWDWLLSHNLYD